MPKVDRLHLPDDRYYDPQEHLWVKIEDGIARVGLDQLGSRAAGTISHVDLHRAGKRIARIGAAFGTLEANKFVGALRAPIRGAIVEVNPRVLDDPRLVHQDPYGEGWLVRIAPSSLDEDLARLVHGAAAIVRYVTEKIAEYKSRGILPEDAGPTEVVVLH
ncbi:MAG: glycine cleavage system protein H [Deltaproteobacteria bacterium]|nr:glycine cleavage system protein H [Deltaproteobacteria bacterium]